MIQHYKEIENLKPGRYKHEFDYRIVEIFNYEVNKLAKDWFAYLQANGMDTRVEYPLLISASEVRITADFSVMGYDWSRAYRRIEEYIYKERTQQLLGKIMDMDAEFDASAWTKEQQRKAYNMSKRMSSANIWYDESGTFYKSDKKESKPRETVAIAVSEVIRKSVEGRTAIVLEESLNPGTVRTWLSNSSPSLQKSFPGYKFSVYKKNGQMYLLAHKEEKNDELESAFEKMRNFINDNPTLTQSIVKNIDSFINYYSPVTQ